MRYVYILSSVSRYRQKRIGEKDMDEKERQAIRKAIGLLTVYEFVDPRLKPILDSLDKIYFVPLPDEP